MFGKYLNWLSKFDLKHSDFIRFINIGLLSACVDFFSFWFLIEKMQASLVIATSGSYCIAFFINFFGHSLVTFQIRPSFSSLIKFSVVVGLNYLLSLGVILIGNGFFPAPLLWKFIALGVIAINGFIFGKSWAFRQ